MDQAEKDRIQHEIGDEANKLFPDALRRIEWPQHGDEPMIEPGELVPRLVFLSEPTGILKGRPGPRDALKAFHRAHGQALKQFQQELSQRWPQIRHLWLVLEDASGHSKGGILQALDDEHRPSQGDFTPVMVRLKAPELEIVDTLITAGIANNRAEAIRWTLTRISERPAYTRLREHTRDIERLKAEF
jgi:hypothetical protein